MEIRDGDLDDPRVRALVALHLEAAHANSPPGSVYALDLSGLRSVAVSFLTAWERADLLGMGALKALDPTSGEVKSMRTAPAHLRRGVGAAMLEHIIATARSRGYARLSLETGSSPAFAPAQALYLKRGFTQGAPFGNYVPTAFNRFYHLDL